MPDNITDIKRTIASADEASLTGLANKGTYKRACKDAEGMAAEFTENADSITLNFTGETVNLRAPLESSTCSCPSRAVCRHIIGAVVLMKTVIPDEDTGDVQPEQPAPEEHREEEEELPVPEIIDTEPDVKYLSERETARVHSCAELCRGLLSEILTEGLVRTPADMPARLEAAAVRCHSVKAADAERLMREIGGRLEDHIERRAAFDDAVFAERLCRCDRLLAGLQKDKIAEDELGEFRKSYTELKDELTLLPIGARDVTFGDYLGKIYYFLDENKVSGRSFLTVSDLRPVFYENSAKRAPHVVPWDLAVPVHAVMKDKLVLAKAKVSGEKLSTSGETRVLSQTKVDLNTSAVFELLIDDFREIAEALDKAGDLETDRMFFVSPSKCCGQYFDKYTQEFVMELEDIGGRHALVKAKYRAETKAFIEQLESIGRLMLKHDDREYTLLVIARVEDGELVLFPVEIYDFIIPLGNRQYVLPETYEVNANEGSYAAVLLRLFSKLRDMMSFIVHCGLRSEIRDEDKLVKSAKNSGMSGLADLASAVIDAASAYRHSMEGDPQKMIESMTKLYDYISIGEKRLQTVSALNNMEQEKTCKRKEQIR